VCKEKNIDICTRIFISLFKTSNAELPKSPTIGDWLKCSTPMHWNIDSNINYYMGTYFLTLIFTIKKTRYKQYIFAKYIFTCMYSQKKYLKENIAKCLWWLSK